jgi:hypothetical protein
MVVLIWFFLRAAYSSWTFEIKIQPVFHIF